LQEYLIINSLTSRNESPLSTMFEDFGKMRNDGKLLIFRGVLTSETITSLLRFAEVRLSNADLPLKKKKVVINVLIECLQNVIYHTRSHPSSGGFNECLLELASENQTIQVRIGNYIRHEETDGLKQKLEQYNGFDDKKLRQTYLDILEKGEISDRGGAGLGLLRMLRETANPLNWNFVRVNPDFDFFSLQIDI